METANEDGQPLYSRPPRVSLSYPWLVIRHGSEDQRQTFYSISQNHYYTKIIPEMSGKKICASSHDGWLVLEDLYDDDCFLLNLQSMEKIQLPALDSDFDYDKCVMLSSPGDPNCHVVFNDCNSFMFCKPGDDVFSIQELEFENEDEDLTRVTAIGGKIYGIMLPRHSLVVIEFVGSTLRFMQSSIMEDIPPKPPRAVYFYDYLVECSDEILFVLKIHSDSFKYEILDFKILRADSSKMTWEEVKNIGQQTIFLEARSGTCCSAKEPEIKRNSIYFVEEVNRKLYVFDLEDRSISIYLPCPNVSDRYSALNWVMLPLANN